MKKKFCIFALALLGLTGSVFYSCEDKDNNEPEPDKVVPEIKLSAPANGASIDLNTVTTVSFSWTAATGITAYSLKLGATQDLQGAVTVDATSNPYQFPATQLDAALGAAGVAKGASATLYWSVVPKDATVEAKIETRSLTLTRINAPTIVLTSPAEGAAVTPDLLPLIFAWEKSAGVGNTTFWISTSEEFTAGSTTRSHDVEAALTYELSAAEYEALLVAAEVGYGQTITFYWQVVPTTADPEVVTNVGSFQATRQAAPAIVLTPTAPAINANTAQMTELSFAWVKVEGITDYTIKFSTDAAFPNDATTQAFGAGNVAAYTFASVEAFNNMLTAIGVGAGETETVYWTVVPTSPDVVLSPTTPLSFAATAFTAVSPADNEKLIVSNEKDKNFIFTWEPVEGFSDYEVFLAKNADLTGVLLNQTVSGVTSLTIPEETLQALIENPDKGLKRYKKNELYWGVKVNSSDPVTAHPVKLYGQRIFVDDRLAGNNPGGPETYKVAVIEYNNKEVVWMAEDLRATLMYNASWGPGMRAPEDRQTYKENCGAEAQNLPDKYLNRTDPPVGVYYDGAYLVDLMPRGFNGEDVRLWRVPTTEEWRELFQAAWAAYPGAEDNVLRHPDFLNNPANTAHANEWGMNMAPNGFFSYAGCGTHQIWYPDRIFYQDMNDDLGGQGNTSTIFGYDYWGAKENNNYGGRVENEASNGNNVRCIFTGDE